MGQNIPVKPAGSEVTTTPVAPAETETPATTPETDAPASTTGGVREQTSTAYEAATAGAGTTDANKTSGGLRITTDPDGTRWTERPDGQRVQVLDNDDPLQTMIPSIVRGYKGRFTAAGQRVGKEYGGFQAKVMVDVRVSSDGRVVATIPKRQSRITPSAGADSSQIGSELNPRIQKAMEELPWPIVNDGESYYEFSYPLDIKIN